MILSKFSSLEIIKTEKRPLGNYDFRNVFCTPGYKPPQSNVFNGKYIKPLDNTLIVPVRKYLEWTWHPLMLSYRLYLTKLFFFIMMLDANTNISVYFTFKYIVIHYSGFSIAFSLWTFSNTLYFFFTVKPLLKQLSLSR